MQGLQAPSQGSSAYHGLFNVHVEAGHTAAPSSSPLIIRPILAFHPGIQLTSTSRITVISGMLTLSARFFFFFLSWMAYCTWHTSMVAGINLLLYTCICMRAHHRRSALNLSGKMVPTWTEQQIPLYQVTWRAWGCKPHFSLYALSVLWKNIPVKARGIGSCDCRVLLESRILLLECRQLLPWLTTVRAYCLSKM